MRVISSWAAGPARKEPGSRSGKGARVPVDLPAVAEPVFLALHTWRAATAKEQGVPAYVVFHDATLREIATRPPATAEELGTIGGIGEAKLTKYAEGVLDTLAECGAGAPTPGRVRAGCRRRPGPRRPGSRRTRGGSPARGVRRRRAALRPGRDGPAPGRPGVVCGGGRRGRPVPVATTLGAGVFQPRQASSTASPSLRRVSQGVSSAMRPSTCPSQSGSPSRCASPAATTCDSNSSRRKVSRRW